MAAVNVVFSGDDSRLAQAHERLLRDQEKLLEKYKGLANQSTKSAAEKQKEIEAQKRLTQLKKDDLATSKQATAIIEANISPQERFNAAVKEAIKLKSQGKLTAEQLQREYKRLKQELRDATGETQKALETEKRLNAERDEAKRLLSSLRTPMERLADSQARLNQLKQKGHVGATEYAMAQKRLNEQFADTEKSLSGKMLASVGAMAASYFSVQTVMQGITGVMQTNNALAEKSRDIAVEIATAQQEAFKNLAGMALADKQAAMESAKDIALEIGFPSEAELVKAVGSANSAGSEFGISAVLDAVKAAAEINKLTPSNVSAAAAATFDVAKATGSVDAESALGFLLKAGEKARVIDPDSLSKSISSSLISGVNSLPFDARDTQAEKIQTSIDTAALYATFTQTGTDVDGMSASTFATTFVRKLDELFRDVKDDPATIEGRMVRLRQDESLRAKFFEKDFGEARFKAGAEMVLDPRESAAAFFDQARTEIKYNKDEFQAQRQQIQSGTPELAAANMEASGKGFRDSISNKATAAMIATIRDNFADTEKATREISPLDGKAWGQYFVGSSLADSIGNADSVERAAGMSAQILTLRMNDIMMRTGPLTRDQALAIETQNADARKLTLIYEALEQISKDLKAAAASPSSLDRVADKLDSTANKLNRNSPQAAQLQATTRGAE